MRDELLTKLRGLVAKWIHESGQARKEARSAGHEGDHEGAAYHHGVEATFSGAASDLRAILDAHDPAGDGVPTEPGWRCSGCGHVLWGSVGECKGYCQDSSGASCDAVACPSCGRFHYWTAAGVQRIEPKSRQGATDSMREDLLAESTTAVEPGQCPTCKAFGVPA